MSEFSCMGYVPDKVDSGKVRRKLVLMGKHALSQQGARYTHLYKQRYPFGYELENGERLPPGYEFVFIGMKE